jgi:hypothetical protein
MWWTCPLWLANGPQLCLFPSLLPWKLSEVYPQRWVTSWSNCTVVLPFVVQGSLLADTIYHTILDTSTDRGLTKTIICLYFLWCWEGGRKLNLCLVAGSSGRRRVVWHCTTGTIGFLPVKLWEQSNWDFNPLGLALQLAGACGAEGSKPPSICWSHATITSQW